MLKLRSRLTPSEMAQDDEAAYAKSETERKIKEATPEYKAEEARHKAMLDADERREKARVEGNKTPAEKQRDIAAAATKEEDEFYEINKHILNDPEHEDYDELNDLRRKLTMDAAAARGKLKRLEKVTATRAAGWEAEDKAAEERVKAKRTAEAAARAEEAREVAYRRQEMKQAAEDAARQAGQLPKKITTEEVKSRFLAAKAAKAAKAEPVEPAEPAEK